MPTFVFAYHGGGRPESPEEGARLMQAWTAWLDGLGDAALDRGNPVGLSKTVSASGVADDGGANPLSGYSLIKAESMDAAVAIAKACPHLEMGTVEVAEVIEM